MYAIYADGKLLFSTNIDDKEYIVLQPKLTMELNQAGSLTFIMPPGNVMYDRIQKLKTTITVKQDNNEIWRGRVLHDEKDFYNRKNVYCEGALSFLVDSIVRPYTYNHDVKYYLAKFINEHNSQVEEDRQFQVGNCTVTDPNDYIVRASSDYPDTLSEMKAKMIDLMGGYLTISVSYDKLRLNYVAEPGGISSQVIRFGDNLIDISEYITAEDVFTVLVPLGAKTGEGDDSARLTIESVNSGKDYIENEAAIKLFGRIVRVQTWDDVTVASNLLTKGKAYLDAGVSMAVTLSIKAIDLHFLDVDIDGIKLGYYNRVVSVPHGLDTYFLCSKMVLDLVSPDKNEYTFGAGFKGMTDKQIAVMKQSQNAYVIAENASSTASSASSMVVDVVGDYVKKSEFLQFENNVNTELGKYLLKSEAQTSYASSSAFEELVKRVEALERSSE